MYQITRYYSYHGYRAFSSSSSWIAENVFTKTHKEQTIKSLRKFNPLRRMMKKIDKKAAVCIPMCSVNGQPSILFTLRTQSLPSHKGEVSFPGGKWQEDDSDIINTGLREMTEELNISPNSVDVWGKLAPLPDKSVTIAVTPILCYLGNIELEQIKPNPSEVSKVFTTPIAVLCDPHCTRYTRFRVPATVSKPSYSYTMPVFLGGAYKVWGLTALITDVCLKALIPDHYTPVVRQIVNDEKVNKPSSISS